MKRCVFLVLSVAFVLTACGDSTTGLFEESGLPWPPEGFEAQPIPEMPPPVGDHPVITTENASQLTEVMQLGIGAPYEVLYAPDNQTIVGIGRLGIYIFESLDEAPFMLTEHDGIVTDATFSLDGEVMFSGGADGTVHLWDTGDWSLTDTWELEDRIGGLAVHPDGERLLTVRFNRSTAHMIIESWDIASGDLLNEIGSFRAYTRHSSTDDPVPVVALADLVIDPAGQYVAYNPNDTYIFEIDTGEQIGLVETKLTDIAFVPGQPDSVLAVEDGDPGFFGFLVEDPDDVFQPRDHEFFEQGDSTSLALHPDGRYAIIGFDTGLLLRVSPLVADGPWDLALSETDHDGYRVLDVAFSPDGSKLATITEEGVIREWGEGLVLLATSEPYELAIKAVIWNDDGTQVTGISLSTTIRTYDSITGEVIQTVNGDEYAGEFALINQDGSLMVIDEDPEDAHPVRRTDSGEVVAEMDVYVSQTHSAFTPDGRYLADLQRGEASGTSVVRFYDVETGEALDQVVTLPVAVGEAQMLVFSPDGAFMVIGVFENRVGGGFMIWELAEALTGESDSPGTTIASELLESFSPEFLAVSADYVLVSSNFRNSELRFWNILTREALHVLPHELGIAGSSHMTFNPDGSLLADRGSGDVMLIDVASGEVLITFQAHNGTVDMLSFSPDGTTLASAGRDGVIRLWRVGD